MKTTSYYSEKDLNLIIQTVVNQRELTSAEDARDILSRAREKVVEVLAERLLKVIDPMINQLLEQWQLSVKERTSSQWRDDDSPQAESTFGVHKQ